MPLTAPDVYKYHISTRIAYVYILVYLLFSACSIYVINYHYFVVYIINNWSCVSYTFLFIYPAGNRYCYVTVAFNYIIIRHCHISGVRGVGVYNVILYIVYIST